MRARQSDTRKDMLEFVRALHKKRKKDNDKKEKKDKDNDNIHIHPPVAILAQANATPVRLACAQIASRRFRATFCSPTSPPKSWACGRRCMFSGARGWGGGVEPGTMKGTGPNEQAKAKADTTG